jgi:hypothetical protein
VFDYDSSSDNRNGKNYVSGFRSLLQLQQFEIEIMATPLLRRKREVLVVVAALRRVEVGFNGGQRPARHSGFVAEASHSDGIVSFVMRDETPLIWPVFQRAMETLIALRGPDLGCTARARSLSSPCSLASIPVVDSVPAG